MEKLIRALRCSTSTPLNGFECTEDCPYRKLDEMGQDILTCPPDVIIDGTAYYIICDYDRMKLDAAEALEKQIPKKLYTDNENGLYKKEYCPTCNRSLFPNDHHCICGQKLDWAKDE